MSDTQALIEQKLAALEPLLLAIDDESNHHAGHVGAQSGGGHFHLKIVSPQFCGLGRVARHRLIYQTLSDLMHTRIHALAIEALTPEES